MDSNIDSKTLVVEQNISTHILRVHLIENESLLTLFQVKTWSIFTSDNLLPGIKCFWPSFSFKKNLVVEYLKDTQTSKGVILSDSSSLQLEKVVIGETSSNPGQGCLYFMAKVWFQSFFLSAGLWIPWLHPLQRSTPSLNSVLDMTLNCIRWWGSSSATLFNVDLLLSLSLLPGPLGT